MPVCQESAERREEGAKVGKHPAEQVLQPIEDLLKVTAPGRPGLSAYLDQPDQPQNPADKPYDPNRNGEPINKFRSKGERTGRWGDLPARLREAMLSSKRLSDDYPAEYQQVLKEYMKRLADEKD